mgnify:CR=1 FL=1
MKRYILVVAFGLMAVVSSAQEIRVGGLLGYASSDIEQAGISLMGEFMLSDNMSISPDLILYFPETSNGIKFVWNEFNANFNYYFVTEGKFSLYGSAGLNYTDLKLKRNGDKYFSDGELGINLGFGFDFPVNEKVIPCLQMKYTISDYDKAFIGAGVKVRVN